MATIGIDFGTTNSRMAIVKNGVPTMIPNLYGFETTPSNVGLLAGGEWSVGEAKPPVALGHVWIGSPKRLLGFGTVEAAGQEYSPPEIAAKLLLQLKTEAEEHLEETVDAAVIAIPASFSHDQRRELREAARLAGLDVQRLIHDPTATALAYGIDLEPDQSLLVVDFGGGSLSIAVIDLGEGVFDVKSLAGDGRLGASTSITRSSRGCWTRSWGAKGST